MFVDQVKIYIKGGDGGKGCISFHREKYRPRGGPDGGDGGKGGDVILRAARNLHTLIDLKYRPHLKAKRGQHGSGNNRHGRNGPSIVIRVPLGTLVKDEEGRPLTDLVEDGAEYVAARGGRGGRGNAAFKSPTNRAPTQAEDGEPGQERWLQLELKLLADVGLVGLPNAGKSSLIARLSAARPKIASYPFTTLTPNLGLMEADVERAFVVADIPGIIEGASRGRGLGLQFLRHIERTRLLLQVIDMSSSSGISPVEDFRLVDEELRRYGKGVADKPRIAAANKMDLPAAGENLEKCKEDFIKSGFQIYPISCLTGEGVGELIAAISSKIQELNAGNHEREG